MRLYTSGMLPPFSCVRMHLRSITDQPGKCRTAVFVLTLHSLIKDLWHYNLLNAATCYIASNVFCHSNYRIQVNILTSLVTYEHCNTVDIALLSYLVLQPTCIGGSDLDSLSLDTKETSGWNHVVQLLLQVWHRRTASHSFLNMIKGLGLQPGPLLLFNP